MAIIDVLDVTHLATDYVYLPPGTTTGHQWLSSDGRTTYIALEGLPGRVAVVDNRARELVTTYLYPNGLTKPHGVFFEQPRQADLDGDQP
jgi:DNA-binding beta-propeller fold protein YncE